MHNLQKFTLALWHFFPHGKQFFESKYPSLIPKSIHSEFERPATNRIAVSYGQTNKLFIILDIDFLSAEKQYFVFRILKGLRAKNTATLYIACGQ